MAKNRNVATSGTEAEQKSDQDVQDATPAETSTEGASNAPANPESEAAPDNTAADQNIPDGGATLPDGNADTAPADSAAPASDAGSGSEPEAAQPVGPEDTDEAQAARIADANAALAEASQPIKLLQSLAEHAETLVGTDKHFDTHSLQVALGDVKARIPAVLASLDAEKDAMKEVLQALLEIL